MTTFFLLDALLLGFALSAGTFVWTWSRQEKAAQSDHPVDLRFFYYLWEYLLLPVVVLITVISFPILCLLGLLCLIATVLLVCEYPNQTCLFLMAGTIFLGSIAGVHWRRLRRRQPEDGIVSAHALHRFLCCTLACLPGFWLLLRACEYWPLLSTQYLTILGAPFEVAFLAKCLYIFGALRAFSALTCYYAELEEGPWDAQIQRTTPAKLVTGLFTYSK